MHQFSAEANRSSNSFSSLIVGGVAGDAEGVDEGGGEDGLLEAVGGALPVEVWEKEADGGEEIADGGWYVLRSLVLLDWICMYLLSSCSTTSISSSSRMISMRILMVEDFVDIPETCSQRKSLIDIVLVMDDVREHIQKHALEKCLFGLLDETTFVQEEIQVLLVLLPWIDDLSSGEESIIRDNVSDFSDDEQQHDFHELGEPSNQRYEMRKPRFEAKLFAMRAEFS
ncbi:hypothetical protein D0Y65_023314 [Glycine soja]|uniref:Uncharacterized protein n=1 Tax=Glycine soja TaxID=3848 RepID=A0A445IXL1_GLYSO|nr:hypothetical protein D0Y65_023314 [Glycine soja]